MPALHLQQLEDVDGTLQAADRLGWEDKQDILDEEEGFVFYDGGTYSRGPIRITPEPGDAPQATSSPRHEVRHGREATLKTQPSLSIHPPTDAFCSREGINADAGLRH